jgi:hypothetical protein
MFATLLALGVDPAKLVQGKLYEFHKDMHVPRCHNIITSPR